MTEKDHYKYGLDRKIDPSIPMLRARIRELEAALLRHGHKDGSCGLCAALTAPETACTGCYYPTPGEFVRRQDCPIHGQPQPEREAN